MNIAILGFGREGNSILSYLKKNPRYRDAKIWILDKNPALKIPKGVLSMLGPRYLLHPAKFDIVFRSPGVPYNLPALARAQKSGTVFSSATKLFFEAADKRGVKIIGITGSKGKTTTVSLLYNIVRASGMRVFLAGNVGTPMLNLLAKLKKNDWVILELSSYQLQDLSISPHIAVILEIFPEHLGLDSHGGHKNLREYYAAKANIARFQSKKDMVIFLAHNRIAARIAKMSPGKKISVSERGFSLFAQADIKPKGIHMFRNTIAAAATARILGVAPNTIKKAATLFRGVPHRLELVRRIGAVEFYNDSIATNAEATAAAVRAFPNQSIVLIAGGYDKHLSYAPLAAALKKSPNAKLVVLFGQNKRKIKNAIKKSGVITKIVHTLKEATKIAHASCFKLHAPCVVLLSPGAASFDMFKNYADRGDQFKALVRKL